MLLSVPFTAGKRIEYREQADFFRILESAGPVSVEFYLQGRKVADSVQVKAGYSEIFGSGFDQIAITSGTAQTVQFVTRLGNKVNYDSPPVGNVAITNTGGTFTQVAATVTTTSAQIEPAKASRRYLFVQNNHATGLIYINLTGVAATAANGILVDAGGSLELNGYLPTGAITAIGSVASNTSVIVVGG